MKNEYITFEQADKLKRKMPKSEAAKEFESYIKELPQEQVGQITVDKKDSIKANTAKARLIRASKALGIELQTKRVGNIVQYWRKGEDLH
jgi:hypothetical protein